MIRCQHLTKRYATGRKEPYSALRDVIAARLRAPFRRVARGEFTALDDFNASFEAGEVVGIVGRNGAGKSTLLKILSRVTRPTEGAAELDGRVGSLLEVGTGFHPELTGRENIYFTGTLLGMRKAEIDRHFSEIVDFSEIGAFIDLPVKRYSSGMYVRLAFSVGAHLDTQILLVDEVLAVGDASFQKKCITRMNDITGVGKTILFVSHNMTAIQRLCRRSLLLERGRLVSDGSTDDILAQYLAATGGAVPGEWIDVRSLNRRGSGEARFVAFRFVAQPYAGEAMEVEVEIESSEQRAIPSMAVTIFDRYGSKLLNCDTVITGEKATLSPGLNRFSLRLDALYLKGGNYVLGLWLAMSHVEPLDFVETAATFEIGERADAAFASRPKADGVVMCRFAWRAEMSE